MHQTFYASRESQQMVRQITGRKDTRNPQSFCVSHCFILCFNDGSSYRHLQILLVVVVSPDKLIL